MKTILSFLLIIFSTLQMFGQSPDYWNETRINTIPQNDVIDYSAIIDNPKYYSLDKASLSNYLKDAPNRLEVSNSSISIQIPNSDGGRDVFEMFSTQTMAEALANSLPEVNSYVGINVADGTHRIRITITPQGFYAMTLGSEDGQTFINPYAKNSNVYMLFSKQNAYRNTTEAFKCEVNNVGNTGKSDNFETIPNFIDDGILRRYRLGVATTVEYSDFHLQEAGFSAGDTSSAGRDAVQAAIVVSIDRVNEIFERDFSVTLQLVANNKDLISLGNANSDPYTNNDLGALINENQTEVDNTIGFGNYDVGHILCTEGGGLAQTPATCTSGKARGATGLSSPVGEYFNVSILSHELGHQFGANHTQSSNVKENFPTAMEPGSGSTIMSYAGVAPPNVQNQSDAMFHYISISEVSNRFITTTGSCAEEITIPNDAPVIQALNNYTIPKNTPFKLEADATDANGDALTYSWDQIDNDVVPNVPMPPVSTSTSGPSFRTFLPTTSPARYFPSLSTLLNNTYSSTWEVLPSVARNLNFGIVVRDNNIAGGQVAHKSTTLTVDNTAGPFRVTSQSSQQDPWIAYSTKTVTWDVANTDDPSGINTQQVDILLSTDAGQTYTTLLADNTPNDGTEDITVPDVVASSARIMVKASDNIFFDINAQGFSIGTSFDPVYCDASANITSPVDISRVTFKDIDNISSSANTGYTDYTNVFTTIKKGSTNLIAVREQGNSLSNGDEVIVWIDYNQDGDFSDSGEKVIETATFSGDFSIYPFGGSITIPSTASLGKTTMRVRMNNSNFGVSNTTPCGNSTYGEVEDYSVVIYDDYVYYDNSWTPANPENGVSTSTDKVLVVDGETTVAGTTALDELTLQIDGKLNINGVLQAQGDIDNDGDLVFKSNSSTTGQLDSFSGNINRPVTVERFIPVATQDTRAFRFLTSSVNSINPIYDNWQESGNSPAGYGTHISGSTTGANGFDQTITGNPSMFVFDNNYTDASNAWSPIANTDNTNLKAGKAYRLFIRGDRNYDLTSSGPANPNSDVTLRATGSLVTGNQNFSLNPNAGLYSFVGNPYQAIIDINYILVNNSTNVNSNFYYVWDPNKNTRGGYVSVPLPGGDPVGSSDANEFVMPGQSFFLETLNNGATDITFTESNKNVSATPTEVFSNSNQTSINLLLYKTEDYNNNEVEADALGINFSNNGNNAVDHFDADKLGNPDENLARSNNGEFLSIENRALPGDGENLALFINGYNTNNYTFVVNTSNFPDDINAYLVDAYTGDQTLLTNGENAIGFTVDQNIPASSTADRFSLEFDVDTFGIDEQQLNDQFKVYPNPVDDEQITIQSTLMTGEVNISLYNMIGQRVFKTQDNLTKNANLTLDIGSHQTGVYFIEIRQDEQTVKKRLIIK